MRIKSAVAARVLLNGDKPWSTILEVFFLYWPVIDDALKSATIDQRVAIKILIGNWKYSPPEMEFFLKSFLNLNHVYPHVDIQVVSIKWR
ncbi:hypothetical protein QYM36_015977 [Artemia franciscana]|uniref:Uncharacterized protein n=1 Tax=Artemia franciscana TaxID=6661 RepID=A0AA88HF19_ARTSF|nr:hypothetical protein QYM36_015977 [Artemia franciscana]